MAQPTTPSGPQRSDANQIINLIKAGAIPPEQAAILRKQLIQNGIPIRKGKRK